MANFHTTSIPDVDEKTHIIGLLGANDYYDREEKKHTCDPSLDGWMVSDFLMLNYLFHGLGKTQKWLTCLDFAEITKRYGEFAHGNCYRKRRVVLDANQQPDPTSLHVSPSTQLLANFMDYFRQECADAVSKNELVLLCVFAHGEELYWGVEIGGDDEHGPLLTTKAIAEILREFEGVKVTMLLTSCFSGGWTITPDLRDDSSRSFITVKTAADDEKASESCPRTATLGRADGSLYVSSIINAMGAHIPQRSEELHKKRMSIKDFSQAIMSELLDIVDPRFGYTHGHCFQVQNDEWEELYTLRTGKPLSDYAVRLRLLREIPPRYFTDVPLDRSSAEKDMQAWEIAHPGAEQVIMAASNYGGSVRVVHKAITSMAKFYMKGFPGRDSLATNHGPHDLINKCIRTPHLLQESAWQRTWEILHYRIGVINLAEKYVRRLGIYAPKSCRWDKDEWIRLHAKSDVHARAKVFFRTVLDAGLIPVAPNSNNRYDKALWYIAAMCAECGLPQEEIQTRLKNASQIVENTVKDCVDGLVSNWLCSLLTERARAL